jgi:hypothetical protein
MTADLTPASSEGTAANWRSLPNRWLQPRSTDRDEAFRERSLRVAIAVVLFIGLLSFAFTIFVFQNAWRLVSYPTLHIEMLVGTLAAAYAVTRGRVNQSGTILAVTSLIGATGFVILTSPQYAALISGIPVFMFVILLIALVMPRNAILPASIGSFGLYTVAILTSRELLVASLLTLT